LVAISAHGQLADDLLVAVDRRCRGDALCGSIPIMNTNNLLDQK